MKNKLYFIVYRNSKGEWEYELDSQRRPTMYKDIQQIKKYAYKFNHKECSIVEYKLNSTPIEFKDIDLF